MQRRRAPARKAPAKAPRRPAKAPHRPAKAPRRPARAKAVTAQAAAARPKAQPDRREARWLVEQRERLETGARLLHGRRPDAAIELVLDPLIADHEKKYRAERRTIHCARTSAEALAYLVAASQANRLAVVLSTTTWADALRLKGYALIELGRLDEARATLEQAVALSPSNSMYLSELAYTYQVSKDWERMRALFQQAADAAALSPDARRKPELGRALRGLGFALVELGHLDEAEAAFRRCLDLDPQDERAQGELAYLQSLRAARARPGRAPRPRT
jgi:tetratricopeptide (TPR) repeat protein